MTSMSSAILHLPYAYIITTYLESSQVDLSLGGRHLSTYETFDMATLKALKYHYIRRERRWICKEDILDGENYEGYESPFLSDPLADFNKQDYHDYNFLFPHGDDGGDEGDRIHRIKGHLLLARLGNDDRASNYARRTSSHQKEWLKVD
ncbi:hypothetical protein Scep_019453 [Stephania cephalantha]|uniref:Uncharacterized protein n=1 Tax=Stephania cephalantha TaxID=152367 RepID=A0AAP0IAQ0_9MAGN